MINFRSHKLNKYLREKANVKNEGKIDYSPVLRKKVESSTKNIKSLRGGRGSGKTHFLMQVLLNLFRTNKFDCNYLFTVKNTSDVKNTFVVKAESILRDFESKNIQHDLKINKSNYSITNKFGRYIFMRGFDDPDKAKNVQEIGISWMEEANQFDYADFKMILSTTREIEKPRLFLSFNPVSMSNWLYENLYSNEEWMKRIDDIHTTCEDNPFLPEFVKEQYRSLEFVDPAGYRVNYLGEWGVVKTGGEFYGDFDPNKHVASVEYKERYPVHISVDNNVLPYVTVSFWQFDMENKTAYQFHEMPIKSPNNYAVKSGELVREYLKEIGYNKKLYVHGDVSMKASNNINEEKKSFYDLFIEPLRYKYEVIDLMPTTNPPVADTGEFVNALYRVQWDGWSVLIDDKCTTSIADYIETKMDASGGVNKKKTRDKELDVSYEKHGHFSDAKRYVLFTALKQSYHLWVNRYSPESARTIIETTSALNSDFQGAYGSGGVMDENPIDRSLYQKEEVDQDDIMYNFDDDDDYFDMPNGGGFGDSGF